MINGKKNFAIIYGINRTKFLHILRSLINQFKKINVSIEKKNVVWPKIGNSQKYR